MVSYPQFLDLQVADFFYRCRHSKEVFFSELTDEVFPVFWERFEKEPNYVLNEIGNGMVYIKNVR